MNWKLSKREKRINRAGVKQHQAPRVVHLVPAPFSDEGVVGGAERYALELAKSMARRVPTTLVTFGKKTRRESVGPLHVEMLKTRRYIKGQPLNPFTLAMIPQLWRADVVHCHQYKIVPASLAALFCRLTGKKCFASDLGGGAWDFSSFMATERWYRGHLHISQYSRALHEQENQGWAHVIMGGVDAEKFAPRQPGGDPTDGVVRFVGRIMPHKGVDDLVKAMPPDLPLEIIGRPYDEKFFAHLQTLAQSKRVQFSTGYDDDELVEAYRRALCVVLPSVYHNAWSGVAVRNPELLGQTLLEAMACGVPAICTDVASMPEIVEDGVTGFVVPPNDPVALGEKLRWLRDHPDKRDQMGRAARQRVLEKFTWDEVVQRCLEIYAA